MNTEDYKSAPGIKPVIRNELVPLIRIYILPLVLLLLYLVYPRGQHIGFDISIYVLLLAFVVSLLYIKSHIRLIVMFSMITTAFIFPEIRAVSYSLAFISIVSITLIEYISRNDLKRLFDAALLISVTILVLSWFSYVFMFDPQHHQPGLSFFNSKVGFINILMLGLFAALYNLMNIQSRYLQIIMYLLGHLFLFSLLATLAKQVYVALGMSLLILIPALVANKKYIMVANLIVSTLIVYLLFNSIGSSTLQTRLEGLGEVASSSRSHYRNALENTNSIATGEGNAAEYSRKNDEEHSYKGYFECDQAESYAGCLQFDSLCRQSYVQAYMQSSISMVELSQQFFSDHPRLSSVLGSPEARSRWLVVCSKRIVIMDMSDRLFLLLQGIKSLQDLHVFGASEPTKLKYLDQYNSELTSYVSYHNIFFDLIAESGALIAVIMFLAVIYAIHLGVKGDPNINILGAMLVAFVGLRLFSGSHYELFYLLLAVALIIYQQYAERAE